MPDRKTARSKTRSNGNTRRRTASRQETSLHVLPVRGRDNSFLAVAVLAVAILILVAATGGPTERDVVRETSPQIARLISVEQLEIEPAQPNTPGGPTTAVVRVPDRPEALNRYFSALNYSLSRVREGGREVPRVYVQEVPAGLADFGPVDAKKALFIRTMLPLVLRANEQVLTERKRIETLQATLGRGETLKRADRQWLLKTAKRYKLAAKKPAEVDFKALLTRVDAVPPSLAITQSILESGWGSSRFARQGNALFGQRTWSDDTPGLAPKKADGFKVRAFDSLGQSVEAYVYNLNTTGAYAQLRRQRAAMRRDGGQLDGYQLAGTLLKYSEEGSHYVEKLRGLMAHNGLNAFDGVALRQQVIAQRVVPDANATRVQVALAPETED